MIETGFGMKVLYFMNLKIVFYYYYRLKRILKTKHISIVIRNQLLARKIFCGVVAEARKGIRSGHVSGSKCIPFSQVLDGSHTLLSADQLKTKFEQEEISLESAVMTSCETGVTCILALGLHRLVED
ncbi:thiosulfate/3-mercaptopyruvate sulfurtransferase 1, mitochondrial-like [Rutidosis leptorrhynchoides]|uniref:thiosulfate/3-mercaptopyruvate sulfurtransferase 1, mitochondrial-like n=1 Tax=Rutidosis leptorrhynchoides TaxID=125765 RepID=UPI003A99C9C6